MAKILIIFDYPGIRELLAEELADDGHLVVPVEKPSSANEVIGTLTPDLVLLNLPMKGKDRWDALLDIKKANPRTRILLLSTYARFEEEIRTPLAEVYVIKSFRLEGLRKRIREILGEEAKDIERNKKKGHLWAFDDHAKRLSLFNILAMKKGIRNGTL